MRWRQKALIQNAIARLPSAPSYKLYYLLQRRFGAHRVVDPMPWLRAGAQFATLLSQQGFSLDGKRCFELGTGWRINLPIALYLCGAGEITSVDLNPYLDEGLIREDLRHIVHQREAAQAVFEEIGIPVLARRFDDLLAAGESIKRLFSLMNFTYIAPCDASRLDLANESFDCYVSYAVLQHIPPILIEGILREGTRILTPGGVMVHEIDMSDHFSHSDSSLSQANFLQFDERQWDRLAGNRYMYQNRMRIDDYMALFEKVPLDILCMDGRVDKRSLDTITGGLKLDPRFAGKEPEINATTHAWLVAKA